MNMLDYKIPKQRLFTDKPTFFYGSSSGTLMCGWCGKDLSNAQNVTYLNGNQPVCDLCLLKAKGGQQ